MDEILIGEKRYVSSKRAAKLTGYAKDYVGQLCREGRVPARLVGRSWYVLESAIQDHRFGAKEESVPAKHEPERVVDTWEAPRYEAAEPQVLPAVNKLRTEEEAVSTASEPQGSVEHLQNAWQAWFDRVGSGTEVSEEEGESAVVEAEEPEMPLAEAPEEVQEDSEDVAVPIRAIYTPPLERPVVREERYDVPLAEELEEEYAVSEVSPSRKARLWAAVRVTGVAVAMVSAVLAVVGSGYVDEYIISNSQARAVAGVILYDK